MSLDLITLTNVLEQANGSERGAAQKLAETQLKEWETQPGFHYLLQVTNISSAISKEEKINIRARLFELIDEPNQQLAIQNAQGSSRICRFDFPQEWPTLFDELESLLQQALREDNHVKVNNLLIILNQVIKTLSMAKIGRTRPALQSKVPIITPILIKIYTKFYNEGVQGMDLTIMQLLVQKYTQSDILDKYIKCYSKIYHSLAKANPTNLILLPCSKQILYSLLNIIQNKAQTVYESEDSEDSDNIWEFLVIKSLLIFKYLINFLFKKGAVLTLKSKSNKSEIESAINILTHDFFNEQLIKNLTDLLISYYIKLRPKDLECWVIEPEEWANDEVNQNYEYQVRQCAENFFQDLMNNFKDLLAPYVLNKVQNEVVSYNEASVQNILIKDSIFTIFQLSANSIHEWIGLNVINDENMDKIYMLLQNLIDPSNPINDRVVKLTAIQTLKTILTDWDFKKQIIKPYLKDFTSLLIKLVGEMEFTESKLFTLNTIADLIYKTNPLISIEELEELVSIVPKFWDASNDSNELILKNSLLRILKNLIVSLNDNSPTTWDLAIPLIKACCSPQSEYYAMLSEDGYELWLALLQFYPINHNDGAEDAMIQSLLELYINALMNQTEILPLILEILRSYTLLVPGLVVADNTRDFIRGSFKILTKYIGNMRDDSLDILISDLEITIMESYHDLNQFEKLLSLLMESGLLPKIISMILDDEQSPITVGKLLLIIARIAYIEPSNLIQAIHYIYPDETQFTTNLKKFTTVWYARMDSNIGNPRNRKIHTLGLTSLLRTGQVIFFQDMSTLISLWISSLEEIVETNGDCEKYHSNFMYEFHYNDDFTIQENGEYLRFQKLMKEVDPVHNLILKDYLKDTMRLVKETIGEANFTALMGNLDKNLVENFEYFLYQINN
ncbi:unnamed protein product [Wickerhamomyces anomalus]